MTRPIALLALLVFPCAASAGENLIVNADFEQGLPGWHNFWSRTGEGSAAIDTEKVHGGKQAVRVDHPGHKDWSLAQGKWLSVSPGQIYDLSGWVQVKGEGYAELGVILRDTADKVIDWSYGGQATHATDQWRLLRSRFLVPADVKSMQVRLIGYESATVWFDDARLESQGTVDAMRRTDLPRMLQKSNPLVEVSFDTADARLSLHDRRTGRRWDQWARSPSIVLDARTTDNGLTIGLLDPTTLLRIAATVRLEPDKPEVALEISASGEMGRAIDFPQPFAADRESLLIMPVNEGISYPAADESIEPAFYHLYGGHGLCMAWYGQTDGRQGLMTLVETPDDAAVRMLRRDGLLCLVPEWQAQKGQFGPTCCWTTAATWPCANATGVTPNRSAC
jgi:hypothetical protein